MIRQHASGAQGRAEVEQKISDWTIATYRECTAKAMSWSTV